MELRDLIVTPIVILIVYVVAYIIRPKVTDVNTRRYFFPALTLKIIGALSLGFIYQFYYNGGDTFNFHTHGSRHIWEAFVDSPSVGFRLILADDPYGGGLFKYTSRIPFYSDPSSNFIIRIAAVLDILTFSSYSGTAVLFAVISFVGMWLFFLTFYRLYPKLHLWIAIACFFVPSVFFWGSGLLKDTITLACLGMIVYSFKIIFIDKRLSVKSIILLIVSLYVIFVVKKYILMCFLPAALLWAYSEQLFKIKSIVLKLLVIPFVLAAMVISGYYAIVKVGEGDRRYSINKIAETAMVTAYDIGFYTGRDAGSGYTIGELDGSFESMLRLAPAAINVTLFRPYIWEVKNPLMLLSSLESIGILLFVIWTLFKKGVMFFRALASPSVLFCMVFSVTFAFAVGVSTFNFGTLARYKIPLLPFFIIGMILILNYSKRDRKLDELETTE
jgi:hypothetical protein